MTIIIEKDYDLKEITIKRGYDIITRLHFTSSIVTQNFAVSIYDILEEFFQYGFNDDRSYYAKIYMGVTKQKLIDLYEFVLKRGENNA